MDPPSSSQSRREHGGRQWRCGLVVVEDNATDVFLIREAIAAKGLELDLQVVEDGEEAISLFARLDQEEELPCPAVVLLDINLPRSDGFEVLAYVRNSKRCAGVPVIVMTSSAAPSDRDRSAALGANAYFQKPSEYAAFLEIGDIVQRQLG